MNIGRSAVVSAMEKVLEVEDLHVEFHMRTANVKAVDGISFSVGPCRPLRRCGVHSLHRASTSHSSLDKASSHLGIP